MAKLVGKKQKPVSEKFDPMKEHADYLDRIERGLESQGVTLFSPENGSLNIDEDSLSLPADITEMQSYDLGRTLNAFTQQKMWYRTLLGRLEIVCEEARRNFSEVSTPYYEELTRQKYTEASKDRIVNEKERVKPYYQKYVDLKRQIGVLSYAIANIEDAIFLLSREVTRRNHDFDEERRDYNVSKYGGR